MSNGEHFSEEQPLVSSKEIVWIQDLDDVIFEHAKDHLTTVDVEGYTDAWFSAGLTPEEAFHEWVKIHFLEEEVLG